MPLVFYIKYFDATVNDYPNRLEFFLFEKAAKQRRDEILAEINNAGGKDKCDIYFRGNYEYFQYSGVNQLLDRLNHLNEIYCT